MNDTGKDSCNDTGSSAGNCIQISFVPVQKSEIGNECNALLRKAYEALKEAGLSPGWTDTSYCLSLKKRQRNELFVLAEFAGEAFDHLRSLNCLIMGASLVLSCLQEGKPLPKSRQPLLSDCMAGIVACCSNIKQSDRQELRIKILAMNGQIEADLSVDCTVLITPEVGSKKYKAAVTQNAISVVTPAWVQNAWQRSHCEIFKSKDDKMSFEKFKCPVFAGLTITLSEVRGKMRETMERLIKENGGKYDGVMKQGETTHLVTDATKSNKYKMAKKWEHWPVFTISTAWLFESISKGYCLNEDDYPAGKGNAPPSQTMPCEKQKCSTPSGATSSTVPPLAFADQNASALTTFLPAENETVMSNVSSVTTSCVGRSDMPMLAETMNQSPAHEEKTPVAEEQSKTIADCAETESPSLPAQLKRMRTGSIDEPERSNGTEKPTEPVVNGRIAPAPIKRSRTTGAIPEPRKPVIGAVLSQYITDPRDDADASFKPQFDIADALDYVEKAAGKCRDHDTEECSILLERHLAMAAKTTGDGSPFYNSPAAMDEDLRRSLHMRLQNVIGPSTFKRKESSKSLNASQVTPAEDAKAKRSKSTDDADESDTEPPSVAPSQSTQEPIMVGWDDPNQQPGQSLVKPCDPTQGVLNHDQRKRSGGTVRNEKIPPPRERVFQLTSMTKADVDRVTAIIKKLGGIVPDSPIFDLRCTHLLATNPTRNEKILTAMARGAWVLHTSYLDACDAACRFVNEEEYEFGSPSISKGVISKLREEVVKLMMCCRQWRENVTASGDKAYTGWNVLLAADKAKEEGLMRILKNGGAEVTKNIHEAKEGVITHIIVDPVKKLSATLTATMDRLQEAGAKRYKTDVIFAYLACEDLDNYLIKSQQKSSS